MQHLFKRVGGIILLILGLAGAGFLVYQLGRDLTIWVLGRHAPAYVTEKWVERTETSTEEQLEFNYYLEYVFETRRGAVVTTTKPVSVNEWGGTLPPARKIPEEPPSFVANQSLVQDRPIDVVYFPLYPRHNRIDDSRYVPFLLLTYVPVIGITFALLALGQYLTGFHIRFSRKA